MKILDWYILKRYLTTFTVLMFLFIPIAITVDLAEQIGKIRDKEVPLQEVLVYYLDFTIFFANLLFPILLFLGVIWFTAKLAENTEIIAFLSSGVSFWRFLRPYIIGATLVCLVALLMSSYLAPEASKGYNEFKYKYLRSKKVKETEDVYRQINDHEYIYTSFFRPESNRANDFVLERFNDEGKMVFKLTASTLQFQPEDSTYSLINYKKRHITEEEDKLESGSKLDTVLPFEFGSLAPASYMAETLNYFELKEFIEEQKRHGAGNINRYKVESYRRWSVPVSAFILTIIAVSVSAMKRRGGMGANLAIGIGIAFVYVFLDKVFGTIAEQSSFSPWLAVWIPNIGFGILAIFLLQRAKR
ncbi:MAG TPA: LptF/LptG family permease [Flavobacteriaceae bacterium]|nr:LptF/LptG family permease [Flavobacteriaceae bacterium]